MTLALSMTACSSTNTTTTEPAEEAEVETETTAEAEPSTETESGTPAAAESGAPAAAESGAPAAETADATYTNSGYTLTIPAEYDSLLFTTTPEENEDGTLFVCSEIASIESANEQGMELDSAGRLFSIRTVDEATLNDMLCGDMSGQEPFATDGNGKYFLFCHPTDVTLIRESYDNEEDMAHWEELNAWAATIPDTFLADNAQLTAAKYGNTELDMDLARIAFKEDTKYTISTLEFLELEPKDVDPTPYLDKLRKGVTYEEVEGEGPDGEYVVLAFPEENIRYEFPYNTDNGCFVRQVWGENDEWTKVYKVNFEDTSLNSTQIMQEWYDALAVANGKK